MPPHPNSFQFHGTSSSTPSSIWSSPNIGQMTEMSHDWYHKMMNDSADLIRVSLESQYKEMELSEFISQSQPPPQPNLQTIDNFPFNSLPNQVLPDLPDIPLFCGSGGGALFTPEPSKQPSKSTSLLTSNRGSVKPPHPQKTSEPAVSRVHVSRGRRYHNTNLLAQYCQEVLSKTAHPSLTQIDEIVDKLKDPQQSNQNTSKKLKSSIREWFRKRREYMATKIYKSCQRLLPSAPAEKEEMDRFIKKIHKNTALLGIIMLESHLPMESEKEKIAFVKEKIVDYYVKYPARRLRNLTGLKRNLVDIDDCDDLIHLSQDDVNSLLINQ